ncbi:MAG: glycosyltransferase [Armatimonadota bacterium]|nr:glycosyltransferase [Armatimonadota bacterium]MDR7438912.1 glycosyltransferase [Armatimonadota bacterium]MDR7562452.1 glycosyltransferase [Armatimonadota bacterium]MDR7567040.1 glycosyltransferase [Armatimonadota bacterium]MDR7601165.1 glycosyltransferase [Armatimonadota bacterium]
MVQERLARLAMLTAALGGLVYLTWRLLYTFNPQALWFSVPLWAAELAGWVEMALFFFMVWRLTDRKDPPPAPPGLSVDVFVPTYDEPLWLLRRTLLGAKNIRYPHETYVLDDGNRPEVAALAREVGCHYLARPVREHAKAGNLNYGLQHSRGAFIAVLDADHVPVPEFLDRVLGYFTDERVALVQVPQEFYNIDSYQHWVDPQTGLTWHEQALFFRVIQPGKDRMNAAFYCGSPAVLRRKALQEVGGFAVESVTEDILTSLRLHRRGWKSIYHNETLAYGVAPASGRAYLRQRLRWGQGAMQVLRLENPLAGPGLTLPQRLSYLASLITWFEGWRKLVYYLSPPVFLLTGILPIRTFDFPFFLLWTAYHGAMAWAFHLASRGYGSLLRAEKFAMARFATYIRATYLLFSRRPPEFRVTPKGRVEALSPRILLPQACVLALNLVGLFSGAVGAWKNGSFPLAYAVNTVWASVHIALAAWAMAHLWTHRERRTHYRLTAHLPVRCSLGEKELVAVLLDCHEAGASLLLPEAVLVPTREMKVRIRIAEGWPASHLELRARPVWMQITSAGTALGVRFEDTDLPTELLSTVLLVTHRAFLAAHPGPAGWGERPEWQKMRGPERARVAVYGIGWDGKESWAVGWERPWGWDLWSPELPTEGVVLRVRPWGRGLGTHARVVERWAIPLMDELTGRTLWRARTLRVTSEAAVAQVG